MKQTCLVALLTLATTLVGCTVVKVSEAGKRINMVGANDVYNCQRIGSVNTSVLDNILFIPRSEQKIRRDLDRLARDQAVLMKADTLVRVSIVGGLGNYVAYDCR